MWVQKAGVSLMYPFKTGHINTYSTVCSVVGVPRRGQLAVLRVRGTLEAQGRLPKDRVPFEYWRGHRSQPGAQGGWVLAGENRVHMNHGESSGVRSGEKGQCVRPGAQWSLAGEELGAKAGSDKMVREWPQQWVHPKGSREEETAAWAKVAAMISKPLLGFGDNWWDSEFEKQRRVQIWRLDFL